MTDAFSDVVGSRRGLDAHSSGRVIDELEHALATTQEELLGATRSEDQQRVLNEFTQAELDATAAELRTVEVALVAARRLIGMRRVERDQSRAALIRTGGQDRPIGPSEPQGRWSPRRVYLAGQAVEDDDGTWLTRAGAPEGAQPGVDPSWTVLTDEPPDGWLEPSEADDDIRRRARGLADAPHDPEHHLGHRLLFQANLMWDSVGRSWRLCELSDKHLNGVIGHLREGAVGAYQEDLVHQHKTEAVSLLPCPPYAYADALDWWEDLPLVGALHKEQQRRMEEGVRVPPTRAASAAADNSGSRRGGRKDGAA